MNIIILIIIFNIYLMKQNTLHNGVYNFIVDNFYLSYYKEKISLSHIFDPNSFFRIIKVRNTNNFYYKIEDINKNHKLGIRNNKELKFFIKKNKYQMWSFIDVGENFFVIKNNHNKCYIKIDKLKNSCDNIHLNQSSKFKLIKIYGEVNEKLSLKYKELINKEPIDILIKYIDLKDPELIRSGIHQIEKDYDNEELRYSVRSILCNIPWVRKIYILMPNKKVRYFKSYNKIKEKIIYINDKDLLGYESSNINAFLFRYWKMKKFGISDNIIIMDDDCFIGRKLEKSDFFYVKSGKVVPAIITSNFLKINKEDIQNNYKLYEEKAKISKEEQNDDIFNYSKYLTLLFIINLFNYSETEDIFVLQMMLKIN